MTVQELYDILGGYIEQGCEDLEIRIEDKLNNLIQPYDVEARELEFYEGDAKTKINFYAV